MALTAKNIVRFVLVVLLFEFLSASFFTTPESSPQEDIAYDVDHSSLRFPAFLNEEKEKEKEKEHFSISVARLNIFTPFRGRTVRQNVKKQKNLFHNRDPRFALFCSLRI
jgi:hypothetical protein